MASPIEDPLRIAQARFPTTTWRLVLAVNSEASDSSREALAALCRSYWRPVYAYVRRRGYPVDEAQDLTQEFFVRVLEKGYFSEVQRERGRFRTFLLAAINHFLSNERDRMQAQKRGGNRTILSLEMEEAEKRYCHLPIDYQTPEKIYEKQWAMAILEEAMSRLRAESEQAGLPGQFERLKPFLIGEQPHGAYQLLAAECRITESAARVTVHRMRRRCQQLLREEIAQTLTNPESVDDEIHFLVDALRR